MTRKFIICLTLSYQQLPPTLRRRHTYCSTDRPLTSNNDWQKSTVVFDELEGFLRTSSLPRPSWLLLVVGIGAWAAQNDLRARAAASDALTMLGV